LKDVVILGGDRHGPGAPPPPVAVNWEEGEGTQSNRSLLIILVSPALSGGHFGYVGGPWRMMGVRPAIPG